MIRPGDSRLAFPPRVTRRVWPRVRHGGARRLTARRRRSSRPALPPLACRHAWAGTVGVESGLVGGLSRAPVLSAGLRVRGRASSAGVRQRAIGLRRLPGTRLDRLPGARADGLPGTRAPSLERLARASERVRRPDAVGRYDQPPRGGRAHRGVRGAARVGARPSAAAAARPLDRGGSTTSVERGAPRRGDPPHPSGGDARRGDADRGRGARAAPTRGAPRWRAGGARSRNRDDGVLDLAARPPSRPHASARVGRSTGRRRRLRSVARAPCSARARAGPRCRAERVRRRAVPGGEAPRPPRRRVRARAARRALAPHEPRRRRRVDRVHPRGRPRLVRSPRHERAHGPPRRCGAPLPLPAPRGSHRSGGRAPGCPPFSAPRDVHALAPPRGVAVAPVRLAEQLDGRSLFGRPLESLDPETFNGYAERLGISVVVALVEDASRLRALDDNRVFAKRASPAPFLIYVRREAVVLPRAVAAGRWTITLPADRDGWVSTRTAYYPLWRARVQGEPIATRRGDLGDLEVRLSGSGGPRAVDLAYGPGTPEIAGIVVSVVGGVVWLVLSIRRAGRS